MIYTNLYEAVEQVKIIFEKNKKVKVEEVKEKRSINQNQLYWLRLSAIEQETGNDKNFLHLYFRKEYLGEINKIVFGKEISEPRSTTTLNSAEFTEYMNKIQVFAATELGIQLPNPEDLYYNQFVDYYQKYI